MSNPKISPAEFAEQVMNTANGMINAWRSEGAAMPGDQAADIFFQMWDRGEGEFATMTQTYALAVIDIIDPTFKDRYFVEVAYSHGANGRTRTITRTERPPRPAPPPEDVVDGKLHFWSLHCTWIGGTRRFLLVAAKNRQQAWKMMLAEGEPEDIEAEGIDAIVQLQMPKKAGVLINFED